jgi:hypothetical protein
MKTALLFSSPLLLLAGQAWSVQTGDALATRREVFEFAEKPAVTREGDKVTITFASKEACDATIAIEDAQGKILRHLASGVLGPNAPAPFQKGTLRQAVVWDSKNDREEYVDNAKQAIVRVSLGLKPQFERTLYWSPYKLGSGRELLSLCAAPEGVYAFSLGWGRQSLTPSVRLFDHDGKYVHTLYPFAADDVKDVQGLTWTNYPPDGRKFPVKGRPLSQTTLLSDRGYQTIYNGDDLLGLAAGKDYVYLAFGPRMNRIAKPGSGKPSLLQSPDITVRHEAKGSAFAGEARAFADGYVHYQPTRIALSPDGRWLYLTSYLSYYVRQGFTRNRHFLGCVLRMPADCSRAPEVFAGSTDMNYDVYPPRPPADSPLAEPFDVTCDRDGRVYVADLAKGLVIFSPEGKLLQQVPLNSPTRVQVAPDTGEIWVTEWALSTPLSSAGEYSDAKNSQTVITLRRLTPFRPDRPPEVAQSMVVAKDSRIIIYGMNALLDLQEKTRRLWLCQGADSFGGMPLWPRMNARILEIKEKGLAEFAAFDALAKKDVVQSRPPRYGRQRPYANPADGCVYIAEQIQPTVIADVQDFDQLVKINPDTGRISLVNLPFDAEDMAFDIDGMAYLRTESILMRFDPEGMREVPFDYGDEKDGVTSRNLKSTHANSAIYFRGGSGASSKIMGMGVNARGDIACSFYSTEVSSVEVAGEAVIPRPEFNAATVGVRQWKPRIYPGRSTHTFIHVWDKHGKMKFEDAVAGLGEISDLKIDAADNLYMIANMNLLSYAKDHPDRAINTLLKVPAGKARFQTTGQASLRLAQDAAPARPPDADGISGYNGKVWLDGAEWAVGGLGSNSRGLAANACHCEANTGLALDLYGRSFAPAIHRFEIAVVDTAGNTVVRIGRPGNVEDGMPLVKDGGPANPRSIGGDEVSIMSAKWLSVLSDRRLFVADRGNYRVLCIKLGYHAEEKVALKDVKDEKAP